MSDQRFLIVKIVALGDVALTSVLLSRIRAEHPGAHVTWLCGTAAAPMVKLFAVDEVLTVDEARLLRGSQFARAGVLLRIWRQLIARRFDRVLLLHADRRYRVVTAPIWGAPVTALKHGVNPLPGRFRGDEFARLLDDAPSVGPIAKRYQYADVRDRLPRASTTLDRKRPRVAISPGGARNILRDDALRRWPVEGYRRVAEALVSAGYEVVLIGNAADAALRPHFVDLPCTDYLGKGGLLEVLEVLRDVDVLVTHDTGPLQFARLVRTPVVALFGPTDPRETVGEAPDVDALWGGAHLACRPCYDGRNYAVCSNNICIQGVTVDAVVERVKARVGERKPATMNRAPVPPLTSSAREA